MSTFHRQGDILMQVPFLDLKAQYRSIKEEIDAAMQAVVDQTAFAGGPFVARFEEAFAKFCGCKYAVGAGSGTDALWMALIASGVGPGDEVITVPDTFIATAEAISFCGAKPVFVDVVESTCNMDPEKLESAITERTKAVIPVHLFGQPADMDPILEIARRHGLLVIEDACQAHGSQYKGRMAGSLGDAGCFSFYPGKNLGAYGEAGAVVTNSEALAEKMRMFRDHGQARKYEHEMIGWNARMDGLQGAVLSVKLNHLEDWNNARRQNAHFYDELLQGVPGIIVPTEADYARHVYHIYAIRVKNRDKLIPQLAEHQIFCGIHYPIPLHLQKAYESQAIPAGRFPMAEQCASEFLSLPMYPELTREQIEFVCTTLKTLIPLE